MDTLNIGTVGTSNIMRIMQEAIRQTPGVRCSVVYSRDKERGREFAASVGVPDSCDDYAAMLARSDVDAVYIASPNVCHTRQALMALNAGKHVILEKPAAVTEAEVRSIVEAARANDVFFLEAVTTLFMPNYIACKRLFGKLGKIVAADIRYGQYSTKYDSYLRGENPNIFNPDMQAGALNDMGIYCVHVAIDLFGEPESIRYSAEYGPNGIDLSGTLILEYPGLECVLKTAKDHDPGRGCLIEGVNGWFAERGPINDFVTCTAEVDGKPVVIDEQRGENRMVFELYRFRDAILAHDTDFFEHMALQSLRAASVLERARLAPPV